jgi:hypothetical protein
MKPLCISERVSRQSSMRTLVMECKTSHTFAYFYLMHYLLLFDMRKIIIDKVYKPILVFLLY